MADRELQVKSVELADSSISREKEEDAEYGLKGGEYHAVEGVEKSVFFFFGSDSAAAGAGSIVIVVKTALGSARLQIDGSG
eukprot:scaffold12189_cov32-Cyclotella_meneghiniana.AAC.2